MQGDFSAVTCVFNIVFIQVHDRCVPPACMVCLDTFVHVTVRRYWKLLQLKDSQLIEVSSVVLTFINRQLRDLIILYSGCDVT